MWWFWWFRARRSWRPQAIRVVVVSHWVAIGSFAGREQGSGSTDRTVQEVSPNCGSDRPASRHYMLRNLSQVDTQIIQFRRFRVSSG